MRRRPRRSPYLTNTGPGFDTALVDMNTQRDFLQESGAAPILNRKQVAANLRKMFDWARTHNTCVVSCLNLHRPDVPPRTGLPSHCLAGTPGAEKVEYSLLTPSILLGDDDPLSLPVGLTARFKQIIFPIWHADLWSCPRADRFLSTWRARRIVVFGVGLEHSIRLLVLGLRARGYPVYVVADASGGWNADHAGLALRVMEAKGASIITTERFLSSRAAARGAYEAIRRRNLIAELKRRPRRAPAAASRSTIRRRNSPV